MDDDSYLRLLPQVPALLSPRPVSLLLGSDRHLDADRGTDYAGHSWQETRVAVTPPQLGALRVFLEQAGIPATLYVAKGAGDGADYSDADYHAMGCVVVPADELGQIPDLDVVHALKEPGPMEHSIGRPFIRIGALHAGKPLLPEDNLAQLLSSKSFAAIYDGSAVGRCSPVIRGGPPIPIRGSQSPLTGMIAADDVGRLGNSPTTGRVVVFGCGGVGLGAIGRLLSHNTHKCSEIVAVDAISAACQHVRETYSDDKRVLVVERDRVGDADIHDAVGLITAAAREHDEAPKGISCDALRKMSHGAVIVDVACDEGGSIEVLDDAGQPIRRLTADIVRGEIDRLGRDLVYVADEHMNRRWPRPASEAHGRAVLPYLATLLYLCARYGGPAEATRYVNTDGESLFGKPATMFDAFVGDLWRGLAFSVDGNRAVVHARVVAPTNDDLFTNLGYTRV